MRTTPVTRAQIDKASRRIGRSWGDFRGPVSWMFFSPWFSERSFCSRDARVPTAPPTIGIALWSPIARPSLSSAYFVGE